MSFGGTATEPLSKKATEVGIVSADFTSSLAVAELITSSQVTASVYSGTDANPAAIISGGSSHVGGKIITQTIAAGVVGVIYQLLFQGNTIGGQTIQQSKFLAVVPGLT